MDKKVVALVVALGIAVFGFLMFQNSQNNTDTMVAETETLEGNVVVYTTNGYSPALLEISVGDEVVFVNNSGIPMWPASDPHPGHTDYPDFDSKTAIPAGESYSYMFTEPGNYGYHDHLNPGLTGTIVVAQ